jgi:hypothetical protein
MNVARKIILSAWVPFAVVFPISRIPLKFFSLSITKYETLSDSAWFWYIGLLAIGIYLLILWEKVE